MFLTYADIQPFAPAADPTRIETMIADAEALATLAAPCLGDPTVTLTDAQVGQVTAILRRAVIRWHESGSGVVQTQTAGPFGQTVDTTRSAPRGLFWPSEVEDLQSLCREITGSATSRTVFSFDTRAHHGHLCALLKGEPACDCDGFLRA